MKWYRKPKSWLVCLFSACWAASAFGTPPPPPYTELTPSNLSKLGFVVEIYRGKETEIVLTLPSRFEDSFTPHTVRVETYDAKGAKLSVSYAFVKSVSPKVVLFFAPQKSDLLLSVIYACVNADRSKTCTGSRELGMKSVSNFVSTAGNSNHIGTHQNNSDKAKPGSSAGQGR
jgi:hypothetical protein